MERKKQKRYLAQADDEDSNAKRTKLNSEDNTVHRKMHKEGSAVKEKKLKFRANIDKEKKHIVGPVKEESEMLTCDLSNMNLNKFCATNKNKHVLNRYKKSMAIQTENKQDPFPGRAPVTMSRRRQYKRGHKMDLDGIKTSFHKMKFLSEEKFLSEANKQAARAELLLQEPVGYLQADEDEQTTDFSQHDIAKAVDITSAQKYFELKLEQFGPYRMNYTRNGRQLLIGGSHGHVAAIDWQTKKLMCEINVMETVSDVKWLHIETMFAVAQKQWTYIYDNQGIELHCLKALDRVLRLEFLPYHFLLVAANAKGYLSYVDVSVGKKVAGFGTGHNRLDVMCQNPSNATVLLGHPGGTVTLWSPNVKKPLVKMLCHGGGTRSIAVTKSGNYLATSGIDRTLKIWDLRMYKQLQSYKVGCGAAELAFSHRDMLALGMGNVVEIYNECCNQTASSPYLSHRVPSSIRSMQFCPYEDVLGVGHGKGFSSLLTPGAGEANFDALEANPYCTKKQRQQAEVKMLLEKIQPDMISLDTNQLGHLNVKSLQEQMDEKKKLKYVQLAPVNFEPRYRKKGASKTGKIEQRRQGVREEMRMAELRDINRKKDVQQTAEETDKPTEPYHTLNRFKKKSC